MRFLGDVEDEGRREAVVLLPQLGDDLSLSAAGTVGVGVQRFEVGGTHVDCQWREGGRAGGRRVETQQEILT